MNAAPSRVAGTALILACLWYLPWLLTHLNEDALWLGIPFVMATLIMTAHIVVTVINNWQRSQPARRPVDRGAEPTVAVIVPTYGEPVDMVARTVRSVLSQDWPHASIVIMVSDDSHRPEMAEMVVALSWQHSRAVVLYHEPPRHCDARRRGEAKAGNLNSAFDALRVRFPDIAYIETRDADDEVGDAAFLREAVGQVLADPSLAFVQTIKEARVAPGDPFGNLEPLFYRGMMCARHAANAVFPCGSGLVWRRSALEDIGGFPTWNLVEDLQSGVEALRRGWRGCYLPIVGAVSQIAPEDIANVYKQRGTWAIDTMRLVLWGKLRGLGRRQQLHFVELGLFYLQGIAMLIFLGTLVVALVAGIDPIQHHPYQFIIRFWPYGIAIEVYLASLSGRHSYETLWRLRQMWVGLAPIYAKACLIALLSGPNRKPAYKVTRKSRQFRWYWRETLGQIVLVFAITAAVLVAARNAVQGADTAPSLTFWAAFYALPMAAFVSRGWYGLPVWHRLRGIARWRPIGAIERGVSWRWFAPLTCAALIILTIVAVATWESAQDMAGSLAASLTPTDRILAGDADDGP